MNLKGHRNDASESKPGSLMDSARDWLSCQAIIWISVLTGLFQVFANPVTNMFNSMSYHNVFNIQFAIYKCMCELKI